MVIQVNLSCMFSMSILLTKNTLFCLLLLLMLSLVTSQLAYAENEEKSQSTPSITVSISGVSNPLRETLLEGLSIQRQRDSARLTSLMIERLNQTALQEIEQTLSVYGYYNPSIQGDLQNPETNQWQATYTIELGEPVRIETLQLEIKGTAAQDLAFQDLLEKFPLKEGDRFRHESYENAKRSLLRVASERGFFDGRLTCNRVEVDTDKNTANVCLIYESGDRYRYGEVIFPKTVVKEDLLKRIQPFKSGDFYNSVQILEFRNALTNSGYFSEVSSLTLVEQRKDDKVDMEVSLKEQPKNRYSAGLGYGTDTGVRAGLGWQNRYINDRGHQLFTDLRFSEIANRISADYRMPFWSDKIQLVGVNAEYRQLRTDTSKSRGYTAGPYYQRDRWGWEETGSLKVLQENFDISDESDSVLLLIPGISFERIWADDTIYTRKGGRFSVSLSGASESLLSDISFAQVIFRGKYILALSEKGRVITRGTIGATGISKFDQLPASLRFFAGGDNTIRGFDFESLGPKNDLDEVVGGRYLAIGSLEYEHMFIPNWGGAVFTDFGNAYNDWSDPIEYSVGIGLRWRSPVGLIRVDIARGISDDNKPFGLHIVIGPDL